jgi:hypothetical protein
MKSLTIALFALLALAGFARAEEKEEPSEEYRIGAMVKAVAAALKAPEKPASLETIAEYGTLTDHYVMIRGWLVQELKGVESQLEATRDPRKKQPFEAKVRFLRKAIRRIDLE